MPTLGEWALMALSAVLMLWGAGAAQRRRRP
ncbi:IPTL-CTERM sorting domain-containing protein [Ottowia beijingensis]|uniref:IPTL-CTERM sorting domain-containing protein n=1 Tax=Ottowia beijingensis TaxID=1207057 RepID=A0A853IXL1_9BURK|nr:IPTL-CTERM sorting domain-containing protein [Ottowia beijingensis]